MKDMNERTGTLDLNVGQTAYGCYKVAIVDGKTHKVKWEMPDFKPNLILNSGLAMVATNYWFGCMTWAYAGTGIGNNYKDSGIDVASSDPAGNVTSVGATINFTTDCGAGDCILWDDGSQGRITSISGPNNCVIIPPTTIVPGQFTVLKTSRTTLVTPAKKCSAYLPGSPHQLSQRIGNVCYSRNTYDFPVETGPVTYTEVGVSANDVTPPSAAVLFSRIVLPAPLSLVSGDYLRLVYQLQITIGPTTTQSGSITVTGWGSVSGQWKLQQVGLSTVLVGATAPGYGTSRFDSYCNEPASNNHDYGQELLWVSNDRHGFAYTWPTNGTARSYVRPTHTALAFTNTDYGVGNGLVYSHTKESVWAIGEANQDTYGPIRVYATGFYSTMMFLESDPTVNSGFVFEFDSDQYKTNIQTLKLRVLFSWSRTLTID